MTPTDSANGLALHGRAEQPRQWRLPARPTLGL